MFNILLIEDNPQHADLAIRILKASGFEVSHAARGFSGLQLTRRQKHALIIVDLELPDMTGQTTCMLIAKVLGETTPPIIAVTSHQGAAYRQSARQAGCQAFISKPYPVMLLLQTVRYFLEKTPLDDTSVLL